MDNEKAAEIILRTAMLAAGKHKTEYDTKNSITVILKDSVRTTSVQDGMHLMRGQTPMSNDESERWSKQVDRLLKTVLNDKVDRLWFLSREGDRFDVWNVPTKTCLEVYNNECIHGELRIQCESAAQKIQALLRGYATRRTSMQ